MAGGVQHKWWNDFQSWGPDFGKSKMASANHNWCQNVCRWVSATPALSRDAGGCIVLSQSSGVIMWLSWMLHNIKKKSFFLYAIRQFNSKLWNIAYHQNLKVISKTQKFACHMNQFYTMFTRLQALGEIFGLQLYKTNAHAIVRTLLLQHVPVLMQSV